MWSTSTREVTVSMWLVPARVRAGSMNPRHAERGFFRAPGAAFRRTVTNVLQRHIHREATGLDCSNICSIG